MRASRRTVPWVRVAARAGACRRLAALACKARDNLLAYTMVPRCMRGNPLPAPLDQRRGRSNIAVRQLLIVFLLQRRQQPPPDCRGGPLPSPKYSSKRSNHAPLRYTARAHQRIPQGKSLTGIPAPAAYNKSPIGAFQLATAKRPLTFFTDSLPDEGCRSGPIANRLWAHDRDRWFESTSLQRRVSGELRSRLHSGDRHPVWPTQNSAVTGERKLD
jgi:hypothetical protein